MPVSGCTLENTTAALGAFSGHLYDDGLCKGTFREARAGKEVTEAALLYYHLFAADIAVFVGVLSGAGFGTGADRSRLADFGGMNVHRC